MNRIKNKFEQLKLEEKVAKIGFLTAGDPNVEASYDLVMALVDGGCDIVEIGVPFSDPLADGPVIQAAANRALNNGITVDKVFDLAKKCRDNTDKPLLFLMYINTMLVYGKEKFIKQCKEVGIDGLIIPDLPYEERGEIFDLMVENHIELIPLVAPTSKERVRKITEGCHGFVYCVSSMGVTGRSSDFHAELDNYISDVRSQTDLPIAIGFGITKNEDVKRLEPIADGVIVGTAIVRAIEKSNGDPQVVKAFVKDLFA